MRMNMSQWHCAVCCSLRQCIVVLRHPHGGVGSSRNSAVSAVAWECSAGSKHVGSSQVAHGACEVPSMKVLTRGRMNEHSRESHDDSELLATLSLLRWPQTPCQAHRVRCVTCECVEGVPSARGRLKTTDTWPSRSLQCLQHP